MPEIFKENEEKEVEKISKEDEVPEEEKSAFIKMLDEIESGKDDMFKDPLLAEKLEKVIESLPGKQQKEVIRKKFLEGKSNEEIAKDLEISVSRLMKIKTSALRQLRHPTRSRYLQDVEL